MTEIKGPTKSEICTVWPFRKGLLTSALESGRSRIWTRLAWIQSPVFLPYQCAGYKIKSRKAFLSYHFECWEGFSYHLKDRSERRKGLGILIAPSLKPSGEDLGRLPELRVGDSPGDLVAKTLCSQGRGPWVWSLVREWDPACRN